MCELLATPGILKQCAHQEFLSQQNIPSIEVWATYHRSKNAEAIVETGDTIQPHR